MSDLESYSHLLGAVYESAIDPEQWPGLLDQVTRFVGGRVGQLSVFSLERDFKPTWAVSGMERDRYKTYFYRHATEDPRLPYILGSVGRIVCPERGVNLEQFRSTPLYRDVISPLDIEHSIGSCFAKEGDVKAILAMMRGRLEGPFEAQELSRLGLIMPHLRRAFEFYALLEQAKAKASEIGAMLDIVDAGIFLADSELRVAHANKLGEALVRSQDGIVLRAGRLACRDTRATKRLSTLACNAVAAAQGRAGLADAEHLEVPRENDAVPYGVSVHPLPRSQAPRNMAFKAELAIVVREVGRSPSNAARRLRTAFNLTPAEAALGRDLAEGIGLDCHARQREIAISTVRTHLRSIYAKTETKRLPQLVAVLRGSLDVTLT